MLILRKYLFSLWKWWAKSLNDSTAAKSTLNHQQGMYNCYYLFELKYHVNIFSYDCLLDEYTKSSTLNITSTYSKITTYPYPST